MRRTQLYLDDQLWSTLHAQARSEKTTISELVRKAMRQRYLGDFEQRKTAMEKFVGSRSSHSAAQDALTEVRNLRQGKSLNRIG